MSYQRLQVVILFLIVANFQCCEESQNGAKTSRHGQLISDRHQNRWLQNHTIVSYGSKEGLFSMAQELSCQSGGYKSINMSYFSSFFHNF